MLPDVRAIHRLYKFVQACSNTTFVSYCFRLYFCQVRVLVFIWSIWVIYLSLVPCCEENEVCSGEAGTKMAHSEASDPATPIQADHPADAQDRTCSPFMFCGNCSGFTVSLSTHLIEVVLLSMHHSSDFFYSIPFWNSAWLSLIWEPPQTS